MAELRELESNQSEEHYTDLIGIQNKVHSYEEPTYNMNLARQVYADLQSLQTMFGKVKKLITIMFTVHGLLLLALLVGVIVTIIIAGLSFPVANTSRVLSDTQRGTISQVQECGEGNWLQIANLNMGDPSQQCPPQWREVSTPTRSCVRQTNDIGSCDSLFYSVSVNQYSRVCGQITGYFGTSQDAFRYRSDTGQTIDEIYVDGVSITYGFPRNHIWTLAAGHDGVLRDCPCDNADRAEAPLPPSFVGDNYFCDSQLNGALWDGKGCITNCCTFNSPPWFSVQLPISTNDDIEVRICADEPVANEQSPVAVLQLYVQ